MQIPYPNKQKKSSLMKSLCLKLLCVVILCNVNFCKNMKLILSIDDSCKIYWHHELLQKINSTDGLSTSTCRPWFGLPESLEVIDLPNLS